MCRRQRGVPFGLPGRRRRRRPGPPPDPSIGGSDVGGVARKGRRQRGQTRRGWLGSSIFSGGPINWGQRGLQGQRGRRQRGLLTAPCALCPGHRGPLARGRKGPRTQAAYESAGGAWALYAEPLQARHRAPPGRRIHEGEKEKKQIQDELGRIDEN